MASLKCTTECCRFNLQSLDVLQNVSSPTHEVFFIDNMMTVMLKQDWSNTLMIKILVRLDLMIVFLDNLLIFFFYSVCSCKVLETCLAYHPKGPSNLIEVDC